MNGRRWKFGWCEYREISRMLLIHDLPIRLEQKPLDVLQYLLEHPLETISKDELLRSIWGNTAEQSLTTAISKLRKAFGGPRDAIILNITGVGYRLSVPVACAFEEEVPPEPLRLELGQTIPRRPGWKALRRLGKNDSSPVWLAENQEDGELRVFKFATDGVHLRALQREVMIFRFFEKALGETPAWGLRIHRWDFEEKPFVIESEFGGLDLSEWALSEDFFAVSFSGRVQLAEQVARAVASSHALGIHHNDLKPGNILVSRSPSRLPEEPTGVPPWTIRIADFGVASLFEVHRLQDLDITDHGAGPAERTEGSSPIGTAIYMAPEVRSGGTPTVLADVYALGILLYQIVSGNFNQTLSPGWEAHVSDPLLRVDIAAAAEINPQLRLSSAGELAVRLGTLEVRRSQQEQAEATRRQAQRIEEELDRARLRRPWVVAAGVILVLGLGISLALYRTAARQRNLANARNAELSAMYNFLTQDLLQQSNPYANSLGPAHAPQESLLDAIRTALPKIDTRFSGSPLVAGRLHATIADAFKGRTQYIEADREYQTAEQRFQAAEGPISPDSIETELKRENAELSSRLPGAVESAKKSFALQQAAIAKLKHPSPELKVWEAFIQASLIGLGPRPQDAIPVLRGAIAAAQSIPGFDPMMLISMKARMCGLYVRLQDGPHLEQTSRELRSELARLNGPESPSLCILDMYLQEALYLEGKYREAAAQGEQNYEHFSRLLGPNHELTLATLANRAAAEGELGLYESASRDDLHLYAAEQFNPDGKRLEEGSLADAAMFECHAGQFESGIQHAQQVIRETSNGPNAQPMFAQGAKFTLAECLIAQQEQHPTAQHQAALPEAEKLLDSFDPDGTDLLSGGTDYPTWLNVARARLALLHNDRQAAQRYAVKAEGPLAQSGAAFYERQALVQVDRSLHHSIGP